MNWPLLVVLFLAFATVMLFLVWLDVEDWREDDRAVEPPSRLDRMDGRR